MGQIKNWKKMQPKNFRLLANLKIVKRSYYYMNRKILVMLSILASFHLLHAKTNRIGTLQENFLQSATPDRIREQILFLRRSVSKIEVSDAQKKLIKEKLKKIYKPEFVETWVEAALIPGTPLPTAAESAAEPQGPSAPKAPGAPEAPAAPGAPTAPSAPGFPGGEVPVVPEQEKPSVIIKKPMVQDLTPDQLKALSDAVKADSDAVIVEAIKQLAMTQLSEKYVKEIVAALQSAVKSAEFKNKKVLRESTAKDGSFEKLVSEIKDAQRSGELYDDLEAPTGKFINKLAQLFQSFMLNPQSNMPDMSGQLFNVLFNIAFSQRPIVAKPAEGAQIISDSQVTNMLDSLIGKIKSDSGFAATKGQKEESTVASLSQDYLKLFLRDLRRLLIHSKFLKIADKDGKFGGKGTILADDGLLNILMSEDPNMFNYRRFRGALIDQMYFDSSRLEEFLKENDNEMALKAMLSDHARRLRAIVVAIGEYLNKKLGIIKSVRDLKATLKASLAGATFRDDIEKKQITDLIQTLETKPDAVVVGKGLQALGVQTSIISDIKKMINAESKKFDVQAKATEILTRAKEAAQKGKVDALLSETLKPLLNPFQANALGGVDRTVDSAYSVLIALLGKPALEKIVKLKEFYNWIYEYGLLMLLFKNLSAETKGMKPQDMLDRLYASLNAMNTGEIKSNIVYFSVITNPLYRPMIEAGLYKGKLDGIIENIKKYDLAGLRDSVTQFVAQAKIGVEGSADFASLLSSTIELLKKTMVDEIMRQLQVLNSGSGGYQLEGLTLKGKEAGRNALIYDALKTVFKNQESAIRAGLDQLDVDSLKKENSVSIKMTRDRLDSTKESELKKLNGAQKSTITEAVQTYLISVADRLERLKKSIQKIEVAPAGEQVTGVPTAPGAPEAPSAPEAPTAPGAPEAPPAPPI